MSIGPGYILAIDQGTTGSRAFIVDQAAEVRGRGYAALPQHYPKPGWVEHDPEEIWQTCMSAVGAAIRDAGIEPEDLKGIGIANQRETFVLWDRATGKPVAPAIVWQDRRTAALCKRLKADGLRPGWQKKTGLLIDPYFSGTKIHWMLEELGGLKARVRKGEIACGTVDSWLVWRLSAGRRHVTDYSNASRTMLYNIRKLDWDEEILSTLSVPVSLLPEVSNSSGVLAETDPGIFFGQRIPIAGLAGDQHAALFGQGCFRKGEAKTTYGTGSFLLMNIGKKPVVSQERLLTTIAWKLEGKAVRYALEGSIFITGAAIQWLRDGLGMIAHASETQTLAESVDGNDDVYFVPALVGLGAPYWDPYARGAILGITRGTTRAHIARAALESIAYQTRDVVDAMQRESHLQLPALRADGGAVGNRFLMQFQADLLGVPVEVPAMTETTALGAAYLAGLGVGFWNNQAELSEKLEIAERYRPQIKRKKANGFYQRWQAAVERSARWAPT